MLTAASRFCLFTSGNQKTKIMIHLSPPNTKKKYRLRTRVHRRLADTHTPVNLYMKLCDKFVNTLLLESSDYHGGENSYSYICVAPIARFAVHNYEIQTTYPDGSTHQQPVEQREQVLQSLLDFLNSFEVESQNLPFVTDGLFGYMAYDAVQFFENIRFGQVLEEERRIPLMLYQSFRFMIVINHFKDEMYVLEHCPEGEESDLERFLDIIENRNVPHYPFYTVGQETSNFTDDEFRAAIQAAKDHCQKGDVFQLVLSRRFEQPFRGDEFNVYRTLRSINPSPYLFFFDYGSFKLFGSSPEAQIVIKDGQATIYPIAGTFRRTGNDQADYEQAKRLFADPKENAEHVMLVDLARNDLSRHGTGVKVEVFKEIQYYSHVIHLVSKVSARLKPGVPSLQLVADTFPAGTLSGAPKYRAMELIDTYEKGARGYYGGCIGYLGFNGDFNQAIMIRSFLSKNYRLYSQAGAGIVAKSSVENELQEVNNKLAALKQAIQYAEDIFKK